MSASVFDNDFHNSITGFLLLLVDCFLIRVAHFLLLGREVLDLGALIFCLLGFLLVLCGGFFSGVGEGGYMCVFSFFFESLVFFCSSYKSMN